MIETSFLNLLIVRKRHEKEDHVLGRYSENIFEAKKVADLISSTNLFTDKIGFSD